MRTIYAIHQGYELYGSDRSFIQCLQLLRDQYPKAELRVIIPREGPLSETLLKMDFTIDIHDLWVLRKSYGFGLALRFLKLPMALWRANNIFRASDLIYINTAVVADYLLVARFHRGKAIAHIRELPSGFARKVVSGLVRWSHAATFFNSEATSRAFSAAPGVPRAVVYNGFDGPATRRPPKNRGDGKLRLLMLGRLNEWKGQDLLVQAIHLLPHDRRKAVELKIVGDSFEGQQHRLQLEKRISDLGLGDQVTIEGFVSDPASLFQWSDVVVVPSRKPEPFGRVAIEGMAWTRPVVAANHGGLPEIIEPEKSGLLFTPNDAHDLAAKIDRLIVTPGLTTRLGRGGRAAYEMRFTQEALCLNFTRALSLAVSGENGRA